MEVTLNHATVTCGWGKWHLSATYICFCDNQRNNNNNKNNIKSTALYRHFIHYLSPPWKILTREPIFVSMTTIPIRLDFLHSIRRHPINARETPITRHFLRSPLPSIITCLVRHFPRTRLHTEAPRAAARQPNGRTDTRAVPNRLKINRLMKTQSAPWRVAGSPSPKRKVSPIFLPPPSDSRNVKSAGKVRCIPAAREPTLRGEGESRGCRHGEAKCEATYLFFFLLLY